MIVTEEFVLYESLRFSFTNRQLKVTDGTIHPRNRDVWRHGSRLLFYRKRRDATVFAYRKTTADVEAVAIPQIDSIGREVIRLRVDNRSASRKPSPSQLVSANTAACGGMP